MQLGTCHQLRAAGAATKLEAGGGGGRFTKQEFGGGGQVKSYPYTLTPYKRGRTMFYIVLGGGGANKFGHMISPLFSPPPPFP